MYTYTNLYLVTLHVFVFLGRMCEWHGVREFTSVHPADPDLDPVRQGQIGSCEPFYCFAAGTFLRTHFLIGFDQIYALALIP